MQKLILVAAAGVLAFLFQSSEPPPRTARSRAPREAERAAPVAATAAQPAEVEALVRIHVRVRGKDGKALAGARVSLFRSMDQRQELASLLTDDSGATYIPLPADARTLVVTAPRHAAAIRRLETRRRFLLRLEPGFSVAGIVTDSSGFPMGGAEVCLWDRDEGCCGERTAYAPRTRADEAGRFRFDGVTHGRCRLKAGKAGHLGARCYVQSGDEEVAIVLKRPAAVSGVVVDAAGAAVPEASVWIDTRRRLNADAAGRFRFENVRAGRPELSVDDDDRSGSIEVEVHEGSQNYVRLVIDDRWAARLRVRLLDAHGAPLAGERVDFEWGGRAKTDDEGRATIRTYAEAGRGILKAEHVRGGTWSVEAGSPEEIELRPKGIVAVRFDVRDTGGAPIRANVRVVDEARTKSGGWLLAPELGYDVRAHAEGFDVLWIDGWRPPREGGTVILTLRRNGTVLGRVLGGGRIYVSGMVEDFVEFEEVEEPEEPAEDGGRFAVELAPGVHTLFVGEPPRLVRQIRIGEGSTLDLGDLAQPPLVPVRGRVLDARRKPVGGAVIRLLWPAPIWGTETSSHADGTFEIDVPKGAPVMLWVHRKGLCTKVVEPKKGVEVVLDGAGTLRLAEACDTVALGWRAGGRVVWSHTWPEDGEYVEHLAQGPLAVRIDGKTVWTHVRAGETTTVDFTPAAR